MKNICFCLGITDVENIKTSKEMMDLNVLSLFDGMSCGQIALKELGVTPSLYYASEIDRHAIAQTQLNFRNTIQLGSVTEVDVSKLERIDLLIGGSPCQSFSFAGKRKGMATTCEIEILSLNQYLQLKSEGFEFEGQSYLFWEYMRILTDIRKYNPGVLFLLENVEMGNKWERVLSEAIGVSGVHINSALVSAQNRKRIYWTNIRTRKEGLFADVYSDIPQPEDRGILLRDILESEVDEKYYLSDKMLNYFDKRAANFNNGKVNVRQDTDKATTLCASMSSCDISDNFVRIPVLNDNGKLREVEQANCIDANYHKGMDNHAQRTMICVTMQGQENSQERNYSLKTNCLTNVQKDNLVIQINPSTESGGKQPYQQNRIYDIGGISPALCANKADLLIREATERGFVKISPGECFDFENPKSTTRRGRKMDLKSNSLMSQNMSFMNYTSDQRVRRLTPSECAKLQTIPDWYKWEMVGQFNKIVYLCLNKKCKKYNLCQNVKLTDAKTKLMLDKLNYAGSIINNNKEQVFWTQEDQLSINQNYAYQKDVKGINKQKKVIASCIIKDLKELEAIRFQENIKEIRNVRIAIKKLAKMGQPECVHHISKCSENTVTHYMLKIKGVHQVQGDIFEIEMEFQFTEKYMKIILEENLEKEKLSIILIALKPIIESIIYTYVKMHPNIHICIQELDILKGKELKCHVSNLRMENIYTPDTSIYKMLGNGWTVEVIKHIFSFLPKIYFNNNL